MANAVSIRSPIFRAVFREACLHPRVTIFVGLERPVRVGFLELEKFPKHFPVASIRSLERRMRHVNQEPFDCPHIPFRKPPIALGKTPEVSNAEPGDAPRPVDIGIDITERQLPDRSKYRFSSVQSHVPGFCDGPPQTADVEQEQHMIQIVG